MKPDFQIDKQTRSIENAVTGESFSTEVSLLSSNNLKTLIKKNGNGYLSFYAKTRLIKHYKKSLGAVHIGGQLMIINEDKSKALINRYF